MKKCNSNLIGCLFIFFLFIISIFVLLNINIQLKGQKEINQNIQELNSKLEVLYSIKSTENIKPLSSFSAKENDKIIIISSCNCKCCNKEKEEEKIINNNYNISFTQEEIIELASLVYLEARGESKEGQQAVAEVVLNRVIDEDFPNNIHDVIFDTKYGVQFSPYELVPYTTPTEEQYEAVNNALYGNNILDRTVVYFATAPINSDIYITIGNHVFCRK